ncbi:sulfotransferase family protein [Confluentibacter citreus]|uniref:sulfotransferase family 2 domain-containing protein n=1 Tax=Confluentibacter citreus TaxID=2007307 RepID=UPI000C288C40|nr:sulfotransferase family 2 domain-containing protein [Confluentibacter citreus]
MISHKHKCIFIHIAKCAGTSIEYAFGVDVENHKAEENDFLFGWDKTNKLWLQHATPQQLIDYKYISQNQWDSYYKFIVYRNSWDRAYSDYIWMKDVRNTFGSFSNFLFKKGEYDRILNDYSTNYYAGDHLYLQKDYFFLNNNRINYNVEIDFENLQNGFKKVIHDLNLSDDFFIRKINSAKVIEKEHYSHFYNFRHKKIVEKIYKEDIDFFDFKFIDKKNFTQKLFHYIK